MSFSSLFFPWRLPQRGFLWKRLQTISPGIIGSGGCLAFLVRKIGRGPDQEWTETVKPDTPTLDLQPNLGEPHRIQSRTSGDGTDAVFL
jgi:hypothetical protein